MSYAATSTPVSVQGRSYVKDEFSSSFRRTDFRGLFERSTVKEEDDPTLDDEEMEAYSRSMSPSFGIPFGMIPSSSFLFDNSAPSTEDGDSHLMDDDDDLMSSSTNQPAKGAAKKSFEEEEGSLLAARRRQRRRHFSLEDYSNETWDEHSNDSAFTAAASQNHQHEESQFKLQASLIPDDAVSIDTATDYICAQVLAELETKLWNTLQSRNEKVIMPEGLLTVIAKHVLQEGSQEPCGLKGCRVNLYFEGFTDVHFLGTLVCDPGTVPTFQLTLTLRQSPKTWGNLLRRQSCIDISTSYKLVKKCLYRDESLFDGINGFC